MEHTETSKSTAHLSGDWTVAGVAQQLDHIKAIQSGLARPGTSIAIDCSGIDEIDLCGFQLISVWLHCIRVNGLEPELINMPDRIEASRKCLGIMQF